MKTVVQAWLKGFPDLNASTDHVICENDLASIQWRANGTHLGEFKGRNPAKKTVSYGGATVYRIKDGKIWVLLHRLITVVWRIVTEHVNFSLAWVHSLDYT
jgi:predicted ester cyclase